MNVAILGATGAVGREMMKILAERSFPVEELRLLASPRSAGQKLLWQGRELTVQPAERRVPSRAWTSCWALRRTTSPSVSLRPSLRRVPCSWIIPVPSAWTPMCRWSIPEINPEDARRHKGIIANPNCTTIVCVGGHQCPEPGQPHPEHHRLLLSGGVRRRSRAVPRELDGRGGAAARRASPSSRRCSSTRSPTTSSRRSAVRPMRATPPRR